ncbi:MAG: type 4b pilus protein PilO2 [Alphaproteobacteria bacterium]|nr:type 4b pilus protein PilO2 [Alphaproteobacteria bacterium SS10]
MQDQERSGSISVADQEYAVGMFWQTAEDPKTAKREAKVAAKQEVNQADLFVMREGFVAQWAIGWTSYGHKSGMPAGAACLADALTGNWLAVFATDNGWWFVASRRDAILPDGDVLYDNEDEPRTRFETEFVRGGWDQVFTPEEWGMGGDTTPLDELLQGHEEPKLSYLNDFFSRLPKSVKIAAAASVVGVGVLGYLGYSIYQGMRAEEIARQEELMRKQQEALRARQEAERLEAERLAALRNKETVARIWEAASLPSEWAVSCAAALDRLSVEVPGWSMQTLRCTESRAQVAWTRVPGGSIASAQYGLDGIADPAIGASGNNMRGSLRLDGEARGEQVAWKLPEIRQNFLELFQGLESRVILTEVARPPKPPDEDPTLAPRPRPPAHFTFSFTSELPPLVWAEIFDRFPGMIVDSADYKIGGTTWSYAGRVYEELTDEEVQQQNAALEG